MGRRILFAPSGIGFAHLGRLLLIARELRNRGHHAAFAYGGSYSTLLERLSYEWLPVEEIDTSSDRRSAERLLDRYTIAAVERCVRDELNVIRTFAPDAIVADLRPSASISSRIAGVPFVSVLNAYLTDPFDVTALFIDRKRHPLRYGLTGWVGRAVMTAQKMALGRTFRQVARRRGVRAGSSLYDFLTGDLNLIADLPEFAALGRWPDSYRFIGPLIWEGEDGRGGEQTFDPPPGQRLIYVTAGHTGDRKLLDLAVGVARRLSNFSFVLTTGPGVDPASFSPAPNLRVHRFIPGSEVMRHATLVMHCGGNGTTYQCLRNGLPAVVVPFNNDQRINAMLTQRHRVGIAFEPEKATVERLVAATRHILATEVYGLSARRFQHAMASIHGPAVAAEAILGRVHRLGKSADDAQASGRRHLGCAIAAGGEDRADGSLGEGLEPWWRRRSPGHGSRGSARGGARST